MIDAIATISNVAKIEDDWDLCSSGLKAKYPSKKFKFATLANDSFFNYFAFGRQRQVRVTFWLVNDSYLCWCICGIVSLIPITQFQKTSHHCA